MADTRTYLDHNATSPLRPEARSAMLAALEAGGNASSVHAEGRRARAIVETAREQVAALVGAKPAEVIFTSGATEANATVLAGRPWGSVACSAIEHPSVLDGAAGLPSLLIAAGPSGDAAIDDELQPLLSDQSHLPASLLMSVQIANGETGVIQDVARLVEICRRVRPDAVLHTDAVQAVGRVAIDFAALGVDAMTLSSHKLGGPHGAGALIVRGGVEIEPLIRGGGQERGRRAGTENVVAIAGFGAACAAARQVMSNEAARQRTLQAQLEAEIGDLASDALVIGCDVPRLANTTCIVIPRMSAETLVIALDLAGVAVSAGAACSSGKVKQSPVLTAMGLPPEIAGCAIRVSTGWSTTQADIETFLAAFEKVVAQSRRARKVA